MTSVFKYNKFYKLNSREFHNRCNLNIEYLSSKGIIVLLSVPHHFSLKCFLVNMMSASFENTRVHRLTC